MCEVFPYRFSSPSIILFVSFFGLMIGKTHQKSDPHSPLFSSTPDVVSLFSCCYWVHQMHILVGAVRKDSTLMCFQEYISCPKEFMKLFSLFSQLLVIAGLFCDLVIVTNLFVYSKFNVIFILCLCVLIFVILLG